MVHQEYYLQKLQLSVATVSDNKTIEGEKSECSIIMGVSTGGLCPFEVMLCEMEVNATVKVSISPQEAGPFFGHHHSAVIGALKLPFLPPMLKLSITLEGVQKPEQREVVAAMAKMSRGHDCGGGCDCGCS